MKALAILAALFLAAGCAGPHMTAGTSGTSGISGTSLHSSFDATNYPEQPDIFHNRR